MLFTGRGHSSRSSRHKMFGALSLLEFDNLYNDIPDADMQLTAYQLGMSERLNPALSRDACNKHGEVRIIMKDGKYV